VTIDWQDNQGVNCQAGTVEWQATVAPPPVTGGANSIGEFTPMQARFAPGRAGDAGPLPQRAGTANGVAVCAGLGLWGRQDGKLRTNRRGLNWATHTLLMMASRVVAVLQAAVVKVAFPFVQVGVRAGSCMRHIGVGPARAVALDELVVGAARGAPALGPAARIAGAAAHDVLPGCGVGS